MTLRPMANAAESAKGIRALVAASLPPSKKPSICASKVLGCPKRCKLAHASLWKAGNIAIEG
jgi:hypothetical protein